MPETEALKEAMIGSGLQECRDDGRPSMESPLYLQDSQEGSNSNFKVKGLVYDLLIQVPAPIFLLRTNPILCTLFPKRSMGLDGI